MSKRFTDRRARNERQRNFVADAMRATRTRLTSRRIYENGQAEVRQKKDEPHYRFAGPVTPHHWSISDIPAVWPEIDKIEEAIVELEAQQANGFKCRMQRKRIEAMACHIDFESMLQPQD